MTGFGRSEIKKDGILVSVGIKSVNSKFLEITLKLPKILQLREFELRELIRQRVSRGKITVDINFGAEGLAQPQVKINFDVANALVKELRNLKKRMRLKGEVKLEHLLGFPQIFEIDIRNDVSEGEWEIVKAAVEEAIEKFLESRKKEGVELAEDISKRIELISNSVDKILSLSSDKLKEKQSKLQERIEKIFKDVEFDRNRLEAELVLLADKLDVTEECIRLKSHIKFFRETLNSGEVAVGRKLNFLIQEILREATTIGAKSDDAEITYLVVSMKEEIEKIREQLQNIE